MRLIDWALNHRGLRGLLGLAWSDRTRKRDRKRGTGREKEGPSVNGQSTESLCSSLMEPHHGQSVSQSGETRPNGVLMKTASL